MPAVDLLVTGGRVYFGGTFQNVSFGVTDGTVSHVVRDASELNAERTVSLDGEHVIPGLVDGHVHFREPGYESKEGIVSGSKAAAAGGVTTVVEMPNTTPPVLTVEKLAEKRELFEAKSCVDYALFGAVTEENVGTGDLQALADAGVTAFKTFMSTSFGPLLMSDKGVLYRAFEEIAETDLPIYIHAEDQEYLDEFSRRARNEDGLDAFFASRPPITETTAIADVIEIVRETGTETVIAHVTTSRGIEMIQQAREAGLPISAEVTPYHLSADEQRLGEVGTVGIGTPPVRDPANKRRLCEALASGSVQLLGSDHAPHTIKEKRRAPLQAAPGMPQLETALPVLLDAVDRGEFALSKIVDCYATAPATIHGLYPKKGTIQVGSHADFVVLDLDKQVTIEAANFESKAAYSPFDGRSVTGAPIAVYQRGKQISENQRCLAAAGEGTECRRDEL